MDPKSDKKPDKPDAKQAGGVRIKNNHFAGAGYALRESELGPRVRFDDRDGHEQLVTPAQAEYLLAEQYKRVHENGREETLPRFVRV